MHRSGADADSPRPEIVRLVVGAGGGKQRLHTRLISGERRMRPRQREVLAAAAQLLCARQLGTTFC